LTPERWQRIYAIFNAAMELDPADRDEFVRRECAGDEAMRAEVIRLLAADPGTGPLDRPAWDERTENLPAAIAFSSGEVVSGRYRIVRFIARGGMGEVYEAEDLELKGQVALKTLLPGIASDPQAIARFKQEIQLSRKIAHPNVCKVFDVDRHPPGSSPAQVLLLSMEYLPGETLAKKVERAGRLSADEALPIVRQMAAALDAAHAAGVIHRDFKTSNVMLVLFGGTVRAVVTDFGLARKAEPHGESTATMPGRIAGTLDYMAPELLAGRPATVASDVYALGMTIYRMLTGTRPFAEDEPLAAAARRGQEPVPAPRTVVPELDERWDIAVARCLDADPERRFASAGDVVRAIEGEAVAAPPRRGRTWTRRGIGVAAAVPALAAVAGYIFWPRIYEPPKEAARYYQTGVADLEAGANFAATKKFAEAVRLAPDFSMAHARLAEAWTELESQEKASQEMVLARRAESNARLSGFDRLYLDAVDLTITRQFADAARKYEELLRRAGAGQPDLRLDLGRAYDRAGKPDDAQRNYLIAAKGPPANPAAWLRLAVLYTIRSDAKNADRAFDQAAGLYELTSNQEGLTEVAYERGWAANRQQKMEAAAGFLSDALRIAQDTRNVQQEIRAKLQLGITATFKGDADAAERYAEEAIDTATLKGIQSLATRGLLQLGDAFSRKRDFEQAERCYGRGLELARRDDSVRLIANAQLRMAVLHELQKQVDRYVPEAQDAIAFFQKNNFALETLQCLVLLGRAKRDQGDYDGALELFRQRLAVAERSQDRFQIMLAQEGIGSVFLAEERYPDALQHYEKELELGGMLGNTEHVGYASLHCASVLWRIGQYTEAAARLDQAEASAAKFGSLGLDVRRERAEFLLSEGQCSAASAICRQLLADFKDPADLADVERLWGLALLRSGSRQPGIDKCEEALRLANRGSDISTRQQALLAAAESRVAARNPKGSLDALGTLDLSLAKLSDSRWRALALKALASFQLGDRAKANEFALAAQQQLKEIERAWGGPAFQTYRARPDFQNFWRPVSRLVSAK
jgi:tetratricopeptide (TPR) repeat protein